MQGITAAEQSVPDQDARLLGDVIVYLVSTAAEYDIAVGDDLGLENAHEYQDALGFIRIAYDLLARVETLTDDASTVSAIRDQLDLVHPAWTGLQPPPSACIASRQSSSVLPAVLSWRFSGSEPIPLNPTFQSGLSRGRPG